jgi:hypothetical protein
VLLRDVTDDMNLAQHEKKRSWKLHEKWRAVTPSAYSNNLLKLKISFYLKNTSRKSHP